MADYVITLVAPDAIAPQLGAITTHLENAGFKLQDQTALNPDFKVDEPFADAWRWQVRCDTMDTHAIKHHSNELATAFNCDVAIQDLETANTDKKLICFDMDSTLIQHEVMDELAYEYGIGEQISAITESAMRGELSFKESFEQRLSCLEGFDAGLIPEIAQRLKLTPGAKILVHTLKAQGVKVAILSGGFQNFAVHLQGELGELDYIHANLLEINAGKLTGRITNELVDEKRKLALIQELAADEGLNQNETIAVGDGANDIPMLLHAGLGVAYRAKPVVQLSAPCCLNYTDLSSVLYFIGIRASHFIHAETLSEFRVNRVD